ncbi:DUF6285 domain-containing protein [Nocardia sp. NPDC056100]|uniref:DUF6285 domain-containing protein n=1 Tax=Nocardia sp. NPDC056100 TaxID=3345712 RepID=UPI0035D98457
MHILPDSADMVEAVAEWLEGAAGQALSGAERYNALVAARALRGVERELRIGPQYFDADRAELLALLPDARGVESDEHLLSALALAIRDGRCDHRSPDLLDALHAYTLRRLRLINPGYPAACDQRENTKETRP